MAFNVKPISLSPINWDFRSPYSFQSLGMPPAAVDAAGGAAVSLDANGNVVVAGYPLQAYVSNTPLSNNPISPVFDQAGFGDTQSIRALFTGAGFSTAGSVVLLRPSNQRTQLIIQNNTLGVLYYAFDRDADNVSCIGIAAGGSREWDIRVPQGNLSLYALANGSAVIEFMNNNVS